MKITDGNRKVELRMEILGSPSDWAPEVFDAGGLPYDEEHETYLVTDVDYCVDYAKDWESGTGDYLGDPPEDLERRRVTVEDLIP